MNKIFVLHDWLQELGLSSQTRLQSMATMVGYELDSDFFNLL
jgi:hypothetical protein